MAVDFYDELHKRGISDILRVIPYEHPSFANYPKMNMALGEIASNPNAKILVYGDYDVDGLMFIKVTTAFLDSLECNNYVVFPYWRRTHELDREAVRYCLQNKFEYFIVGDTASSDIDTLAELTKCGIKIIVIDHHVTENEYSDYPDDVTIINSQIENRMLGNARYKYSAGALAYTIYARFAEENIINYNEAYSAYALISLYSDCMDMSNECNRAIYYRACSVDRSNLPTYVLHFLNEYQSFNARFIGFWYAPRINALFRGENFELLNKYFFDKSIDSVARSRCIEEINEYYKQNRAMTRHLGDLVDVDEFMHFVVADLDTAIEKDPNLPDNIYNYTGLVANKLSERYCKTAICYSQYSNFYKGSVRDLYGKDYLSIFRHICYAAGHNSAFGLKINLLDLPYFLDKVEHIDDRYSITDIPNEPIIVQHEFTNPDSALIEDMAKYNEFSGSSVPVAYLYKQLIGAMRMYQNAYYYRYDWGDYFIQSDYPIEFGTKMIIKPIKSGRTKLLYQG